MADSIDIEGNAGPGSAVGSGSVRAQNIAGHDVNEGLQQHAALIVNTIAGLEHRAQMAVERAKRDTDDTDDLRLMLKTTLVGLTEQYAALVQSQRMMAEQVAEQTIAWVQHRAEDRAWKTGMEATVGQLVNDIRGDGEGLKTRSILNRRALIVGVLWLVALSASVLYLMRFVGV